MRYENMINFIAELSHVLVDILGTEINKYKPTYRHLAETVLKVMALE